MMLMLFQEMGAHQPVRSNQDIPATVEELELVDQIAETETEKLQRLVMTETTLITMDAPMTVLLSQVLSVQPHVPLSVGIHKLKELKHVTTEMRSQVTGVIVLVRSR